jgi:quercetin dioxygenase-like cupin family protein
MKDNLTCNQDGASERFYRDSQAGLRTVKLKKRGEVIHGHKHNKAHLTIMAAGSVHVRSWNDGCGCGEGVEYTLGLGDVLEIKADWFHEITALEDNTIYHCTFFSPDSKSLEDAVWDMAEARG